MEQTTESTSSGDSTDIQPSTMVDGLKIMEALSNEDAVNLFFYAKDGIESSTEAIKTLGLSQKRYYTRLKMLLESGLIEKTDEGYRHTFMGTLVYKLGLSLLQIVEKREQLEVLNPIYHSTSEVNDKTSQIFSALSIELPSILTSDVKIISNFEEFVSATVDMIKSAEKNICMATQYMDVRVIKSSLNIMEKGIEVRALIDKIDQLTNALKLVFTLFQNPVFIKSFYSLIASPKTQIRLSKIPFTFMIIDGEKSMIEIKNMITEKFEFSIFFDNKNISSKLLSIFNSIWELSSDLKNNLKEKFNI